MIRRLIANTTSWCVTSIVCVALTGCIGPQGKCACAETASSASGEGTTEAVAPADIPPAVKPTGPLVYDGKSNMIADTIQPPGSWFVMNDGTAKGSMLPTSTGEIATSVTGSGVHTTGTGYTEWGGGIGFNFVGEQMITPVDASAFKGIKFKASGKGYVHLGLATINTMPEFGVCQKCYDHFASDISLTSEPKEYAYPWANLKQSGWGTRTKFDPKTIIGFNFTSKGATAWDFTITDIEFIE